jgi:hypothetical protein
MKTDSAHRKRLARGRVKVKRACDQSYPNDRSCGKNMAGSVPAPPARRIARRERRLADVVHIVMGRLVGRRDDDRTLARRGRAWRHLAVCLGRRFGHIPSVAIHRRSENGVGVPSSRVSPGSTTTDALSWLQAFEGRRSLISRRGVRFAIERCAVGLKGEAASGSAGPRPSRVRTADRFALFAPLQVTREEDLLSDVTRRRGAHEPSHQSIAATGLSAADEMPGRAPQGFEGVRVSRYRGEAAGGPSECRPAVGRASGRPPRLGATPSAGADRHLAAEIRASAPGRLWGRDSISPAAAAAGNLSVRCAYRSQVGGVAPPIRWRVQPAARRGRGPLMRGESRP